MASEIFTDPIVQAFHAWYKGHHKEGGGPPRMRWRGFETLKCPMDMIAYAEILQNLKPHVIIEGGTCSGGSALFLADVLTAMAIESDDYDPIVVTMDWDFDDNRPKHPRITYVTGDTLALETYKKVEDLVFHLSPKLLILDDGHSQEHVHEELELYMPLLVKGDYLIVEDTDLGGPWWGLEKWIGDNPGRLERDTEPEKFMMTFNPMGYWKVVA